MNENVIPMRIEGGEIQVKATLGQTVIKVVAPDEYVGDTTVTPSGETQVLSTNDKLVRDNITVNPAPTEILSTDHNGTFTPSDGKVGFSQVTVDVNPDLRPLSVSENGTYEPDGFDGYSDVTVDVEPNLTSLSVTENGLYLPESGVDGFDRVSVDVPVPSGSMEITDNGTYNVTSKESVNVAVEGQWIDYDDVPVALPEEYQRVEYIESSGTQYIELPIGFYPTDTIHFKGANHQSGENDKYLVASKVWNNDANRFGLLGNNKYVLNVKEASVFCFGNMPTNESPYSPLAILDGEFHKVSYKNRVSIIDNLEGAVAFGGTYFGSETANLKLFYGYNSNTAGKICYYIHEKADGRKLALYACYRKSDGVIGMYDVENDVFYTNDGTGDFTKGQDI